jgi:hypothetical protein
VRRVVAFAALNLIGGFIVTRAFARVAAKMLEFDWDQVIALELENFLNVAPAVVAPTATIAVSGKERTH